MFFYSASIDDFIYNKERRGFQQELVARKQRMLLQQLNEEKGSILSPYSIVFIEEAMLDDSARKCLVEQLAEKMIGQLVDDLGEAEALERNFAEMEFGAAYEVTNGGGDKNIEGAPYSYSVNIFLANFSKELMLKKFIKFCCFWELLC